MPDAMKPLLLSEAIRVRRSWRTYAAKPVEPEKRDEIRAFLNNPERPPFGSDARFKLIDFGPDGPGRMAGTYGVIKGARTFLAGAVRQGPMDLEDFGYRFERIILFATGLGLDTCWMGATFSRSLFAEKIDLSADETLPAVSPLGYRTGWRSITDALFHYGAGSKDRKPWETLFFEGAAMEAIAPGNAGELALPFELVRLAPSAVNKQPWRLVREPDRVRFFLCRTKGFERRFRTDLQRIDMGIAMCHFEIGAVEAGLGGRWEIEPPGSVQLPDGMAYVASWMR